MSTTDKELSELFKLTADYVRHITTLSSGSILLIATVLTKLTGSAQTKQAVLVALFAFVAAVIGATLYYTLSLTFFAAQPSEPTPLWADRLANCSIGIAWLGFVVGMIATAIFAANNI